MHRLPYLMGLKSPRALGRGPGAREGTPGLVLLPTHAPLTSHQDTTSAQDPSE